MTHTDREQQARALADKLNRMESLEYDGYDELLDAQQVMVVALLAATERATLERVDEFVTNYHFTKMTTTAKPALRAVTDIEDWLRQQIKEIHP